MDEWNFINQWCKTKWIPGWQLDIDLDCEAQDVIGACETFVASKEFTTNGGVSHTLPQGGKCTTSVDASQAMGRIQFSKATELGVLYNGYKYNDTLTVPKGEIQDITVYNGKLNGPVTFNFVTSGAEVLGGALMAASTIVATTLF